MLCLEMRIFSIVIFFFMHFFNATFYDSDKLNMKILQKERVAPQFWKLCFIKTICFLNTFVQTRTPGDSNTVPVICWWYIFRVIILVFVQCTPYTRQNSTYYSLRFERERGKKKGLRKMKGTEYGTWGVPWMVVANILGSFLFEDLQLHLRECMEWPSFSIPLQLLQLFSFLSSFLY